MNLEYSKTEMDTEKVEDSELGTVSPTEETNSAPVNFFFTPNDDESDGENDSIGENEDCFEDAAFPDESQNYSVAINDTNGDTNFVAESDINQGSLVQTNLPAFSITSSILNSLCSNKEGDSDYGSKTQSKNQSDSDTTFGQNCTTGTMQMYRNKATLVAYSDSESSDSESVSSYESSIEVDCNSNIDNDSGHDSNEDCKLDENNSKQKQKKKQRENRVRALGEVFPEELPDLEYLNISAGEDIDLKPMGTVTGIVDTLVVIQSMEASPALFDDTVLFLESRQPLGLIFETLGTVETPFYSIRFNSNADITKRNINVGDKVMYAPKASNLTKYVFIKELLRTRYVDASWENDNEPPPWVVDYSDDEEEYKAKRKQVMNERKASGKTGGTELNEEIRRKKKKRSLKKRDETDVEQHNQSRSTLPRGTMNRNPFEVTKQPHQTTTALSTRYVSGLPTKPSLPSYSSRQQANNKITSSGWKVPPTRVMFGGKPAWQEQPAFTGTKPDTPFTFSLTLPRFQPPCSAAVPPIGVPPGGGVCVDVSKPPPRLPAVPYSQAQNPFMSAFNSSLPPPPLVKSNAPPSPAFTPAVPPSPVFTPSVPSSPVFTPSVPPSPMLRPSLPPSPVLQPSIPPPTVLTSSMPPPSVLQTNMPPPPVLQPNVHPPSMLHQPNVHRPPVLQTNMPPPPVIQSNVPPPTVPQPPASPSPRLNMFSNRWPGNGPIQRLFSPTFNFPPP